MTNEEIALAYHEATKHHFNRYARSMGYLDWANQPDPFRRYAGAKRFLLPLVANDVTPSYESLYREPPPALPLTLESFSVFFECSMAISAWKEYQGSRWALRCNPSSGNLHPTEAYVLVGALTGLSDEAALWHYAPDDHALERRARTHAELSEGVFLVGLASVFWREAWKYGERAFRYCQHDTGHAIAALAFAARALGWRTRRLDEAPDDLAEKLLGLGRHSEFHAEEPEHAECLLLVDARAEVVGVDPEIDFGSIAASLDFEGRPNVLSADHVQWSIIDAVASATRRSHTQSASRHENVPQWDSAILGNHDCPLSLRAIAKQRRSAVAMDGESDLGVEAFYRMLGRTIPESAPDLFTAFPGRPLVHLALFVHRVRGLRPGLYFLVRDHEQEMSLREAMRRDRAWIRAEGCPVGLHLYRIEEGDCRGLAAQISCTQEIAGMGAFSLGMIAKFEGPIREQGAAQYRRLFWEAGFIGQILYLEAEAAGLRATGIGCYFDDPVHEVFGFEGKRYQSMYHFTVGGPFEDTRLTTLPPYSAERMGRIGWIE
ncbi:MAG: SagB/ThcOx family dehydrogenase [Candidatus Hydrogenedentota bacterium]